MRVYSFSLRTFTLFIQSRQPLLQDDLKHFIAQKKKQKNSSPMSNLILYELSLQLAKGLQVMHSKNVIHLDIKPANILFGYDFNWKYGTPSPSLLSQMLQSLLTNVTGDLGISKVIEKEGMNLNDLVTIINHLFILFNVLLRM